MNSISFKIILFFASCFFILDAFADNVVVGNGVPASCNEGTFDIALADLINGPIAQGGTMTFNCGPNPDVILLSSQKFLQGQVIIDGGNKMTLNAQNLSRIFNINVDGADGQTEVLIRNIVLTNGNSGAEPFGGAILTGVNTRLDLFGVTISNSLASTSGGAIANVQSTILNITNSNFINNLSINGGAIATRALVTIVGSTFTNNNASGGEGGAIQSYEQVLDLSNSSFTGNGARFGGAIFKGNARLICRDCQFRTNTVSLDGGAIYIRADSNSNEVQRSYFYNNVAIRDGGAINASNFLSLSDSTLSGNSGRAGGAIRINGGEVVLLSSTLNNNTASLEGGGVSMDAIGNTALFSYLTTSNNTVTGGVGGDLAITSTGFRVVDLLNSTLMGAQSSIGGNNVHLSGEIQFNYKSSLLWPRQGAACVNVAPSGISSLGGNITDSSCNLSQSNDLIATTFSGFGLGEFANYGGAHNTFLPLPGSIAIDLAEISCEPQDSRKKNAPIDGDGNGSALCDSGAVERQLVETAGALFRNGFE